MSIEEEEPERAPERVPDTEPDRRKARGGRARAQRRRAEEEEETLQAATDAPSWPDPASVPKEAYIAARTEAEMTIQYLDDLEAANRFKTFLLGTGVEVPSEVLEGLARLTERLIMKEELPAETVYSRDYPGAGDFSAPSMEDL